jgi:hypothetical protein
MVPGTLRLGSEPRNNEPFSEWVMWYTEKAGGE